MKMRNPMMKIPSIVAIPPTNDPPLNDEHEHDGVALVVGNAAVV